MTEASATWRLQEHKSCSAVVNCGDFEGQFAASDVGSRFISLSWNGKEIRGFLVLATGGPSPRQTWLELTEAYQRGNDVVVSWAPSKPSMVPPHLYCRVSAELGAVSVQLVISVQTELLDAQPRTWVE